MVSVFNDPKQLVRQDKITEFWPVNTQSSADRVNASVRFIIYATCILYLIRRDIRVFVLGATGVGVLYAMEQNNMIKHGSARAANGNPGCQLPTADNPMANVLLSDYDGRPDRPSACDVDSVSSEIDKYLTGDLQYGPQKSRSPWPGRQRNALARQFVTSPVSGIPGDQTAYAEFLYGKKGAPMCKTDGLFCDPNARGVQLEAFGGIDTNGDVRGGGGYGNFGSGGGAGGMRTGPSSPGGMQ
jgi:hypothetical protein